MLFKLVTSILLFGSATLSIAQEHNADVADKVIASLFQQQNGKFLCVSNKDESHDSIRATIMEGLNGVDLKDNASANNVAKVIYTKFPCPFSPYRSEMRPAKAEDINGVWIFPEASQRFRYGPQSPLWKSNPALTPIRCEGVFYNENGQMLVAQAVGTFACPTSQKMKELEALSHVESWTYIRDGRVRVDRSDVPNYLEEWDIFVVDKDFDFAGTKFHSGDLVEYRRREKGNDLNVTTMFRHLQKMP